MIFYTIKLKGDHWKNLAFGRVGQQTSQTPEFRGQRKTKTKKAFNRRLYGDKQVEIGIPAIILTHLLTIFHNWNSICHGKAKMFQPRVGKEYGY
jgi:hypothetical protein